MNSKTKYHIEKYICLMGFILFITGFIFIIFTVNKINHTNVMANTTNTNISVIASWGLLLIGINIFILTCIYIYICKYRNNPSEITMEEPLLYKII